MENKLLSKKHFRDENTRQCYLLARKIARTNKQMIFVKCLHWGYYKIYAVATSNNFSLLHDGYELLEDYTGGV